MPNRTHLVNLRGSSGVYIAKKDSLCLRFSKLSVWSMRAISQ